MLRAECQDGSSQARCTIRDTFAGYYKTSAVSSPCSLLRAVLFLRPLLIFVLVLGTLESTQPPANMVAIHVLELAEA